MTENFPKLEKEINTKVQKSQRTPKRFNPNKTTPRHIIITLKHQEQREDPKNSKRKEVNNV